KVTGESTNPASNLRFEVLGEGITQDNDPIIVLPDVGTYTIQVTDLNTGCFETIEYTVDPYDTIEVTASDPTPVTCLTDTNGTFDFEVTGYTGTYSYEILDETGTAVPGLNGSEDTATGTISINSLPAGNFTVRVTATAAPLCSDISNSITIPGPSEALSVQLNISNELTCDGDDGVLTAVAQGGWPGIYEYSLWIGGVPHGTYGTFSTTNTFTDLTAGDYEVIVRDVEGCEATDDEPLTQPTFIVATAAQVDGIQCEGDATA